MIQAQTLTAEQLKEMLNKVICSDESTPNNRRIAEYISVQYKSIAFMTASEIAEKISVSQAAITRFVTNVLGFHGFSHFMKIVQDIIRSSVTGVERYVIADKSKSNLELLISQELGNLNELLNSVSEEKLMHAAALIGSRKTILIVGFRTGVPIANYFYFFLKKIHPEVRLCTTGSNEVFEALVTLDRKTTLVMPFVFPRYPREMIEVIQFLKLEKYQFITTADSYNLQVEGICECDIVTPITITTLFDSYTTSFCILNILLDMIGRVDPSRTKIMLGNLEEIFQKNRVFFRKQ